MTLSERKKQRKVNLLQDRLNQYGLSQTVSGEAIALQNLATEALESVEDRSAVDRFRRDIGRGRWRPKLLIIGYARHGKDTACEILKDNYGLDFSSSSWFVAKHLMHPRMPEYATVEECYADRGSRRQEWFDAIREYNAEDGTRLAREILRDNDVYCGMRSSIEFEACKDAKIFTATVWIDRSAHLPPESDSSCTITRDMADIVIDNNGDIEHLEQNLHALIGYIFGQYMATTLREEAHAV